MQAFTERLVTLNPETIACTRFTMNPFRKVHAPKAIKESFEKNNIEAQMDTFLDPRDALEWAKSKAEKDDIILVTGSVFLAGELRAHLL